MAPEDILAGTVLNWSSLLIALHILGVGYIGLVFLRALTGKKLDDMNLYDKIIQSAILGFLSFSIVFMTTGISITDEKNVFIAIGTSGIVVFLLSTIICSMIAYFAYLVFYYIPNVKIDMDMIEKIRRWSFIIGRISILVLSIGLFLLFLWLLARSVPFQS